LLEELKEGDDTRVQKLAVKTATDEKRGVKMGRAGARIEMGKERQDKRKPPVRLSAPIHWERGYFKRMEKIKRISRDKEKEETKPACLRTSYSPKNSGGTGPGSGEQCVPTNPAEVE